MSRLAQLRLVRWHDPWDTASSFSGIEGNPSWKMNYQVVEGYACDWFNCNLKLLFDHVYLTLFIRVNSVTFMWTMAIHEVSDEKPFCNNNIHHSGIDKWPTDRDFGFYLYVYHIHIECNWEFDRNCPHLGVFSF